MLADKLVSRQKLMLTGYNQLDLIYSEHTKNTKASVSARIQF